MAPNVTPAERERRNGRFKKAKAALEKGLVLVTSLWQADGDGMSWLDGGCNAQHPHCNLNASTAVFSDVAVVG